MPSPLRALALSNPRPPDMLSEKSVKPGNGSSNAAKASRARAHKIPPRKQATGNWNPDWEPFAKLDLAWTEKVIAMAIAPAVTGALDAKTLELVGIALDVSCTNMYAPGVRRHIRRALKAGATKEEITAVLQCVSVLGIHTMSLSAPILLDELATKERRTTTIPN